MLSGRSGPELLPLAEPGRWEGQREDPPEGVETEDYFGKFCMKYFQHPVEHKAGTYTFVCRIQLCRSLICTTIALDVFSLSQIISDVREASSPIPLASPLS